MGTILVPLFAHYRPTAPLVQAAYAEGLLSSVDYVNLKLLAVRCEACTPVNVTLSFAS